MSPLYNTPTPQASCYCEDGWLGVACDVEDPLKKSGGLSDMATGSPIAIALAALAGALVVLMIGGYAYNYAKGSRGVKAIPGYSFVTSKVSHVTGVV